VPLHVRGHLGHGASGMEHRAVHRGPAPAAPAAGRDPA
jgi:hypothetical protein